MTRSWKYMVVVLTLLFPVATEAQERARPDTASVAKYPLGSFVPLGIGELVRRVGMTVLLDSSTVIEAMGMADSVMFTIDCGDSKLCNEDRLTVLTIKRVVAVADTFELLGVERRRIKWLPPKICKTENEDCRGVFFYINDRLVTPDSKPSDFQRNNALEGRVSDLERGKDSTDRKLADYDRRVGATERTNVQQGDSIRAIAEKMKDLEKRPPTRSAEREVSISFLGVLVTSVNGINVVTPRVSLRNKPRDYGFGMSVGGGLFPLGRDDKCNRAAGQLEATVDLWATSSFGGSLGLVSSRNFCVDGGPENAHKVQDEINGVSYGPNFSLKLGKLEIHAHAAAIWAFTHKKGEANIEQNKFGFRAMLGVQTPW